MQNIANIDLFDTLQSCGAVVGVFNDEFDDLRKELDQESMMARRAKKAERKNRLKNKLLVSALAGAAALGGLDYLGGHKNDLPFQPVGVLAQAADTVRGGVNTIRGTADNSELTDLETQLKNEQLLRTFEQAEKMRERTRRLRTERELNDTKIAKENWKQMGLHRGDVNLSEAPGFGKLFVEKGTGKPIKDIPVNPFALGGGMAGLGGAGAILARLLRKTKNKK